MAKITKTYESDIDLTVFSVVGTATFEEIWEQTRTFLGGKPSKLVLWDFTSGTVGSISSNESSKIAELGLILSSKIIGGKAALLAPKDIDFGVSRMFQAFSEIKKFPLEVGVFRDLSAARNWLTSEQ